MEINYRKTDKVLTRFYLALTINLTSKSNNFLKQVAELKKIKTNYLAFEFARKYLEDCVNS